jgi:hypothetical protein
MLEEVARGIGRYGIREGDPSGPAVLRIELEQGVRRVVQVYWTPFQIEIEGRCISLHLEVAEPRVHWAECYISPGQTNWVLCFHERPDGDIQLVQLFERSILEFNPPPSDHPVVRGRLVGYSAHAPDWAREPIEPFESNQHSWYFPQTGHSLSNGFLGEWIERGGLEVFGYPITEEFSATSDDGRPYVAQVFERARFEWWPDRVGTGGEITYGLLVVEMQRDKGFLP